MITYEFIDKGEFLIVKYSGKIDKHYMVSFLKYSFPESDKKSLRKVLIDFRDANLDFKWKDIKDLIEVRKNMSDVPGNLNSVYLIRNINETVYTTLFAEEMPRHLSNINICSTIDYTIKLLRLTMTIQELEEKIKNLSHKF